MTLDCPFYKELEQFSVSLSLGMDYPLVHFGWWMRFTTLR